MAKNYFNNAVVGNSRMLGCLSQTGELTRLFWPNIDYPQHIEKFSAGVFYMEHKHSTMWLHEDSWQHRQCYIDDSNIVQTICENGEKGLQVVQTDFVLPDRDILIRQYEIENKGECNVDLGFVVYSSAITTTPEMRSTLFDFDCDALIHYKHGYYLSISADRDIFQFQLGNNAYEAARYTELGGYDSIGMMPDGAISLKVGVLAKGEKKIFAIYICAASTLKELKKQIRDIKNSNHKMEFLNTQKYWQIFLEKSKGVNTGNDNIDKLYKRSLLVFKLMSDEKTGGLLAAPEIDEEFTKCGRYAYCWGRDAAFITGALDKCGLTGAVDKFYEWASEVQDESGSWQQRYHMDGNLAPSWGLQIDETGSVIWGMLRHYEVTGNVDFLKKMWKSIKNGVDFLVHFIDEETGLPGPSYDLWEERLGVHAYSSAAVYAGIKAGVDAALILGEERNTVEQWKKVAETVRTAIEQKFWKEDRKCFIRSIRTKLNPWGSEHSSDRVFIKVNPKGYYRDFTMEDGTADISLLGLSIPFEVFDINDCRIEDMVHSIERILTSPASGGIKRYENDNYIGGNPWVLATLWVALYHARKKNFQTAEKYFQWAVNACTELYLLPEQVSKDTGEPAWVIPLTWSHAMFVLVLFELIEGKVF